MDSLTLKHHNFFQNKNNRKATNSFPRRTLISKLQEEVLKSHDISVTWGSQKNWPGDELRKSHFFSIVTFK